MYTLIATYIARWLKHRSDVATLRMLLGKDDSVLEDMGLRRADVEEALRVAPVGGAREIADKLSRRSLALDLRF